MLFADVKIELNVTIVSTVVLKYPWYIQCVRESKCVHLHEKKMCETNDTSHNIMKYRWQDNEADDYESDGD